MKALLEVFYQPGTLFESLPERRSAWVAPLLASIVVMTLLTVLTVNLIGMREIMQQRLATSGLNPEQIQQALANADKPAQVYVSYAAAAIVAPVTLLVIAGALTAFGMMTSRAPKFGAMFAMVALAFFPYWLVTGAMSAVIILATPDRSTLDISNIIATNAAAYMDRNTVSKGMYSLYGSLDALSFALIWLLGFGFSKLTKAGMFFGLAAVGTLWAFYVLMKMGASLVF
ncbi:MAG: hypothetical protein EBY17_09445 [Acidobacteriia bacterium]|nr:hypothetical protein [Terriglobia bacterium]